MDVDDIPLFIQNHQHWKTEASRIRKHLHRLRILIGCRIIDMDIDKIVFNNLIDSIIIGNKI